MKWILSIPLLIAALSNAHAWGPDGHKIVAEIGERDLTLQARASIKKLLPGTSLADMSTWADSIKGQAEWAHTKAWHFVNVNDGQSYESISHDHSNVITAIEENIQVLRSKTSTIMSKQNALKFLVHLVGDIHQPLHAGRSSDQGGNTIKVTFEGWTVSLHQLWDSTMINNQNLDYKQYAYYLETKSRVNPSLSMGQFPYRQVINEDLAVRGEIYKFNQKSLPAVIDRSYVNRNTEIMNSRLLLGGKRLAAILNSIYK